MKNAYGVPLEVFIRFLNLPSRVGARNAFFYIILDYLTDIYPRDQARFLVVKSLVKHR
jgi:hypothetical protein